MAKLWSAVTCHRFLRRADLSARQRRAERRVELPERTGLVGIVRSTTLDGDKSPVESADKSAHSKALGGRSTTFEVVLKVLLTFLRALGPLRTRWPRSRATPRTNSATLRRALRRAIRDELRAAGLHKPRAAHDTTH